MNGISELLLRKCLHLPLAGRSIRRSKAKRSDGGSGGGSSVDNSITLPPTRLDIASRNRDARLADLPARGEVKNAYLIQPASARP